ncbi:TlpA family protein disulfide reductase [Ichthyenterobacterium magnum]|uniref:Thioredoxin-like protein n=1 Tax=Ichthyenterobacterium magnum TaxID=1230530 RepID=A0A420DWN2_9FLAO|nr:thioredoxin-like domain-containing protein [Ichthyenterobacterium magnum]RKE98640.1 thioredoxin-like protein [Ichthyenterobacterium magnum]
MKKLLFLIALLPTVLCAQHKINGIFSPANEFTYAFLYQSTPTGSDYINRGKLEADGSFSITLDSTATAGLYKIVYALPPEENNFDFIYNGNEDVSLTFSLEKGLEFTESNENKLWSSYTKSMELVNMTISNFYTKENTDEKGFNDIFKTLKDTQTAFEDASKGTMASTFIKANRPYIPAYFEDITTYSSNLKKNYLKHIDFSNPLLQSSDFLVDRVLAYVFGISANTDIETYKKDIDNLVISIGDGNFKIKTILLELIWRRFTQQENETVANYMADNYLLQLAEQTGYSTLLEDLVVYKNNAIGMKAQNFDLAITNNGKTSTTNLHDLDIADQYLVIFWSSACGHCLDELPKVKDLLATKPNLKVIAFGLEDEAASWRKEIANFPDFIHVLGLQKWENPVSNQYGVKSTPSYFLLDKNKTIIAKPYDAEALKQVLK